MYHLFVSYGTLFVLGLLLTSSFLPSSQSLDCKPHGRTIVVDKSGGENIKTLQAAIDTIPRNNNEWIKIHVKAGTYLEKVTIESDRGCVILEGEGRQTTIISWNDHVNTDYSATFTVKAENVVAKFMSFLNSYNIREGFLTNEYSKVVENVAPAEAILLRGDKNAFYECGFLGYQDTIADQSGRHYLNGCYVEGAIDFIYGSGQSFYENCIINVTGSGYIAAQGRSTSDDPSGFVFEGCHVVGGGPTFLARAYREYSRVIYNSCTIDANVVSQGWDAWKQIGHENKFEFVESGCKGAQYDTSKRPSWVKLLETSSLADFTRDSFINQDGWIQKLPNI